MLLILLFHRPVAAVGSVAVLMLLIYIPLGHAIDRFMYNRRLRAKQRDAQERKAKAGS